jgi:hypothetical protein
MTVTVTPTPRDARGFTAIKYTTPEYHGSAVFNRKGEFVGLSRTLFYDRWVTWLDDPEALPPGVLDAARAAYLETLT